MRLRRSGLAAFAVAAVALLGAACTPAPNELTAFGISRYGEVSANGHDVTLRGTVACERPGNVDLFMFTADGFSPETAPTIECDGPELQHWAQTFHDADTVQPERRTWVSIEVRLWQVGEPYENEDWMDVSRSVELS